MTAADQLRQSIFRAERAITYSMHQIAVEGLYLAISRSSGPFSQPDLNAMDNPYATWHAAPTLDPTIINTQSGDFLRHWIARSGVDFAQIRNDDWKADLLELGTPKMHARRVGEAIELDLAEMAEGIMQDAVNRALSN